MQRRTARTTLRELGKVIFLTLVVVWLTFLVAGIFKKEEVARQAVDETRAELAALDARKKTIAGTVHNLDTERGQEASFRETFGVAKPGEDVIIVVSKKELPPPPIPTLWDRVKDFFGQ